MPPGREQYGVRPAIVMGLPDRLGRPRFPVVMLTPLTTNRGQAWAANSPRLYPLLAEGLGDLPSASIILLDQTRFLSVSRISGWIGALEPNLWRNIRDGLVAIMSPAAGGTPR